MEPELFNRYLLGGAINGLLLVAVAFLISRFWRDVVGRGLLVIVLFAAAGAYFGFAIAGEAGAGWTLVELLQVVAFGILGLLGLRGSAYWLAAGWALHPVWDMALHYFGPGRPFTPPPYAVLCLSYDLVVAAYVLVAYHVVGARRLGFRLLDKPGPGVTRPAG